MIFDTHTHYDAEQFDNDRVELLSSMREHNVGFILNVGATLDGCKSSVEFARKYPFMYAAVGVHPDEVGALNDETFAWMEELLLDEKAVAVGEIGLDYYWDNEPREVQKEWFIRQLALAKELSLPVLIHSREAAKDTLDIIKEEGGRDHAMVIHCFSYGVELAREYLDMGHDLGIGGVLTFKKAKKLKKRLLKHY